MAEEVVKWCELEGVEYVVKWHDDQVKAVSRIKTTGLGTVREAIDPSTFEGRRIVLACYAAAMSAPTGQEKS